MSNGELSRFFAMLALAGILSSSPRRKIIRITKKANFQHSLNCGKTLLAVRKFGRLALAQMKLLWLNLLTECVSSFQPYLCSWSIVSLKGALKKGITSIYKVASTIGIKNEPLGNFVKFKQMTIYFNLIL
jgi:hypothetical protein